MNLDLIEYQIDYLSLYKNIKNNNFSVSHPEPTSSDDLITP